MSASGALPVVLLPGMLCDEALWDGVREALPRSVADRLVDVSLDVPPPEGTFDGPSGGPSDGPSDGPSGGMSDQPSQEPSEEPSDGTQRAAPGIRAMAARVLAAVDGPFVLVGLSLGAIVGFEVCRRAPERVAGLAVLSSNAAAPRREQYGTWRAAAEAVAAGEFERSVREDVLPGMFRTPGPGPEWTRAFLGMARRTGPARYRTQLAAQATRTDALPVLAAYAGPVLVVSGGRDALCPPATHRAIAEAAPRSRLHVLPDAGHLLPIEEPRATAQLLAEWLADDVRGPVMGQTVLKSPTATEDTAPGAGGGAVGGAVRERVAAIIEDVRVRGDAAVRSWSASLDDWAPDSFRLSPERIEEIVATVPDQVLEDIRFVQDQVRSFARHQRDSMRDLEVETLPGVHLGQKHIPVGSVGAYVPGGRYPLTASAHMTILTAKVAGVPRVAACTPPIRGEVPAATVAAMHLAGADEIHLLGGVQAVAALALGTAAVDRVDLLAGPGNAYVAEAKRQLFGEVGIDLFAGPTEILVVADDTADPFTVAVDLLSQAEHGPDSPAVLISTSERVARAAVAHIERLLPAMPTRDFAEPAWRDHGEVVVVGSVEEAYALADSYASEHVEVLTEEPRRALEAMRDYGALFLGEGTCVSYGDKVIGTNHVLPTRGAARYTGGLWVGKYLKTVTYQEVTDPGSSALLGEVCGRAARVELFEGHARSGDVRAAKYGTAALPWNEDA